MHFILKSLIMKTIFYLFMVALFVWSCGAKSSIVKKTSINEGVVTIANDSLEYEITIIDIKFYNYLITAKPMSYYSVNYLENKNRFYVSSWNDRVRRGYKPNIYENVIEYEYHMHYGLEVNYKLYKYFRFVETEYGERF